MASEGEGFDLPIVEAARVGLPVLARPAGVPRSRQRRAPHGSTGAMRAPWPRRCAAGSQRKLRAPCRPFGRMPLLSWDDSAEAFLAALRAESWPMRWVAQTIATAPTTTAGRPSDDAEKHPASPLSIATAQRIGRSP